MLDDRVEAGHRWQRRVDRERRPRRSGTGSSTPPRRSCSTEGYAAVSSRSVAAAVDIQAPLVHYYFPTIDDLFVAVLRRPAGRNVERMAEALASPEPLRAWWELASDPRGTAMFVELLAAANHRPALKAEVGEIAHEVRRMQMDRARSAARRVRHRRRGVPAAAGGGGRPGPGVQRGAGPGGRLRHLPRRGHRGDGPPRRSTRGPAGPATPRKQHRTSERSSIFQRVPGVGIVTDGGGTVGVGRAGRRQREPRCLGGRERRRPSGAGDRLRWAGFSCGDCGRRRPRPGGRRCGCRLLMGRPRHRRGGGRRQLVQRWTSRLHDRTSRPGVASTTRSSMPAWPAGRTATSIAVS